jgi:hypothetical protein
MSLVGSRPYTTGLAPALAGIVASVLGLTSMTRPAVAFGADTALIMGGTGLPVPPQSYVDAVEQLYLVPNGYGAYTPQALTTPEEFYPVTGVNSLPPTPRSPRAWPFSITRSTSKSPPATMWWCSATPKAP